MGSKVLVWLKKRYDENWLRYRRNGIGGSDIPALFGIDKWKSATEVFFEKTGSPLHLDNLEEIPLRLKIKDFIAKEFANRTGYKLIRRNAILKHPKYPFMIGSIDRWILNNNAGLMCKSIAEYSKGEWSDDKVPYKYILQCQHYMAITNAEKWWIALLIGGNKFKQFCIERDNDLIEKIILKERLFWKEHVMNRTPPPYDGSYGSKNLIKRLFPVAKDTTVSQLPDEAESLIEKYMKAESVEKQAYHQKLEAENNIKALMGTMEFGTTDKFRVEWRNIKVKNKKTFRRFKINKVN
jgi:putative phage-type endonuclease